MKQQFWWPASIAALGSGMAVAVTMLHHVQASRAGVPGGYLPMILCAAVVGLLAGACGYASAPPSSRGALIAILIGLGVSSATWLLLLATLITAIGT